ncbi:TRAPP II complex [Sparassis latifolia]|uniref:Uncharacterized protein n=1 Tax=Sparassis crispa TaxID=139825 RepID=A0A401GIN0_9APHY|nr:hypothetical protein SCP_0403470 [Sparassis crispa]GBE81971.1 hypothetical protein SCP_0403470 [Sparassis crispa]
MEPSAFASLAHVRVLLLPVGDIRRDTFEKWVAEIKSFQSIRLGDIPSDPRDDRARFMPSPLATGYLHLSYPSHPPPSSHHSLALFRPSAFPLGVIGIATCSQSDSMSSILAHFNSSLSQIFPHGSMFPVASNCFVFEESDGNTTLDVKDHFPGLVIIPGMMGNKTLYIGTLVADLCSQILGEFAILMQSLESPLGNEYLNAALFPVLPPPSEMPRSLEAEFHAHASLPPLPSQSSQPELASPNGPLRAKTPLAVKRTSTAPGFSGHRHASLPVPAAKRRPTAIGAVSSHGRLFKVLGDLFLLSGRLEDSSVWYGEAIALFKGAQDTAWHASALEGLATIPVIEAWASNRAVTDTVEGKEPWSEISEKLAQATALYFKSTPQTDPETSHSLLSYLYSQSVFRQSCLLFSVWSAKGWGSLAFATMLQPSSSPNAQNIDSSTATKARTSSSFAEVERRSSITGISRAQIAGTLSQVHGPWLLHLGPRDRIKVLQTLAGLYGALGYHRKEAYILREVLGSIMDLVVCGREEGGGANTSRTGLGLGIGVGKVTTIQGTVGVKLNESAVGNESVLKIVRHICRVHGIDLEAVKLVNPANRLQARFGEDSDDVDADVVGPADDAVDAIEEPFGWPELQIGIVREAIAVAEALPDYPSVAQFSLSSLKTLHPVMSHNDQHHLYRTAARALATAKRRGDERTVEYWSGQPIVSIEVLPLPFVRLPMETPVSALAQAPSDANPILVGLTDPFLYNPRKLTSGQSRLTLVQNEIFELMLTLRNPYVFDLELQTLALSTSGVPFESNTIPIVVPANTYHPVRMSGKALAAGTLVIRGCIVQAPGGISREFVLPLSTEEEEDRRLRRRSAIECESGRSKHSGLRSRPWAKGVGSINKQIRSDKPSMRFLECKIVPEQPLLRIRRTSLTHGAVMLYNGETSTIRITLENVSMLPIDFIRLTFDDSTIAPAQQALADGELSVFETYETEYDLIHRPALTCDSSHQSQVVAPGEKAIVTVDCFGKVGCTSGAVHVSYAYVRRQQPTLRKPTGVFHTRQLTYPVLVTVYHMLECHAMDILPYSRAAASAPPEFDDLDEPIVAKARKGLLNVEDVSDWCLFSVEVRNTYGLPFEVTFERTQPDVEHASTSCLVPPGSTSRLLIPIKKFFLPAEHISRAIPTLSDRQFVVTKSALTSVEEKAQRELFWYREELFKFVHGRWRENGGTRCGELSLRQQRMALPMLENLRTETAKVKMLLFSRSRTEEDPTVVFADRFGGHPQVPPFTILYLRTRVINLSASELILTLNLSLEPAGHIIYQGVTGNIPLGKLESGASCDVETPIAFVSCGKFELLADVHALDYPGDSDHVGQGRLTASVVLDNS